jgi:hypothetical protein
MLRARMHTQLFILAACMTLAALLLTLVPTFAVHAASGFSSQTRLGFPAGDDWETALTSTPKLSHHGVS